MKNKGSKLSFMLLLLLAAGTLLFVDLMLNQNFNINEKAAPVQNPNAPTQKPKNTPKPKPRFTPVPTPTPTPTPTPFPRVTACNYVSVSGAESYAGIYNGKSLYYLKSGSTVTLTANTTPQNGWVHWVAPTFSIKLPNGGTFSTNFAPIVNYTAPINTSGSDQGVEIRGDISEYPDPWIYCPPMTFAIHTN